MTIVVAYKWAANPQDASVSAEGIVDWSRAKLALSEYDPVAIQLGSELATATGDELVGVSVGTSAVGSSMAKKAAMSRGFDRGLVVADDQTAEWNLTQVAQALAALIQRIDGVNLVLTGDASIDENAKLVSALLAGHLGWPCFQDVAGAERSDDGWSIIQNIPGGTRTIAVTGPAVLAIAPDATQAKVPGMKDILAAGKKKVDTVAVADLEPSSIDLTITERSRPAARTRQNKIVTDGEQLAAVLHADGLL
ncbi:electron transfer flavoprotein subunit beta/FixA family protein [Propionibacterium australiense]|uniref:Electron transfer flavoprotein small subunit n=1 Tax=Propionibacterium australiense TaxID=119981 RepID=A0A383S2M7_9ACTN|nr:electron transfer flavoprotein beta subunit/FixA family protein [Propionibacterium australiense]RLP11533.1 electron transfer flavoprotein beta subunit/FixA family protein [Propionibacterium australiense]RLP12733.1 electron transfer flavoprotein beta subunit/FixA family protein [Propionibacterium australiense]SYZ32245.1 Electron transfer flavoprotein, alpha/beta-subunit, N-terminal [Propionibacterium australiense]VEH90595.1 Electron transfer flavoprotein small subunit [Propionibacterium austr